MFMGIDPGKSGGFAVIDDDGDLIEAVNMPSSEVGIWQWISEWDPADINMCCIERVHAFPGQGVTAMFTFGQGYGTLRMAVIAATIAFETVGTRTWQKTFGVKPRQTKKGETKLQFKDRLKDHCQQLFPQEDFWDGTLGFQRAVCDAILIAEHTRRVFK